MIVVAPVTCSHPLPPPPAPPNRKPPVVLVPPPPLLLSWLDWVLCWGVCGSALSAMHAASLSRLCLTEIDICFRLPERTHAHSFNAPPLLLASYCCAFLFRIVSNFEELFFRLNVENEIIIL